MADTFKWNIPRDSKVSLAVIEVLFADLRRNGIVTIELSGQGDGPFAADLLAELVAAVKK